MPLDEGALAGWAAFSGYVGYNILRKTWPSAIAQRSFISALAISKGQIGTISSLHGMAYGLSKFFGSLVCDRLGGSLVPRVFGESRDAIPTAT